MRLIIGTSLKVQDFTQNSFLRLKEFHDKRKEVVALQGDVSRSMTNLLKGETHDEAKRRLLSLSPTISSLDSLAVLPTVSVYLYSSFLL